MSRPEGAELQRTESYQWPTGHVSHLTEGQQSALEKFKSLCEQKGYYAPASEDGKTPASHDDETMLRYLRARKFVPQEAFGQFKDTEDWRTENQLDTLYETIDIHEYDQTRRLYPQWTGRRDKRGIPFYVYEVSKVNSKDVTAYSNDTEHKHSEQSSVTAKTPKKMLRLFALYENLCRFVLPMCSALPDREHPESPISQSNNLVDISHVSLAKFWALRNHMSDASNLATAHYPETLDRIFVVGAPGFFSTIWGWAKNWFDPITVSKIFILNDKNMLETLEKYIDRSNIPKKYGGDLDWSFGDMPFLEPGIANNLRWKEDIREKGHRSFPIGPIKWQYDDDGDLVATAIGSENGKQRYQVIAGLRPEEGITRLALSPGRGDRAKGHMAGAARASEKTARPRSQKQEEKPSAETNGSAKAPAPATAPSRGEPVASQPPRNSSNPPRTSSDHDLNVGRSPASAVDPASRAGTYTVPVATETSADSGSPHEPRKGTSHTRYEQQALTHAAGTLSEGTPEIRLDGQGEKQGVMDPRTVGQAPKEHPMPEVGEAPKGYVDQAKEVAEHVVQQAKDMAASAGLVSKDQADTVEEKGKKEDPEVDGMDAAKLEEFLREKSMSTAPTR